MDIATEITEARMLLEKGSRYELPAPFLLRIFGKKKIVFTMYEPTAAIYLEILSIRLGMGITDEALEKLTVEQGMELMTQHGKEVAKIVALAILGIGWKNRLFNRWLTNRLFKTISFTILLQNMQFITLGGGLEAFMNIIGLCKVVRLTKPNHPSHEAEKS